VLCEAGSEVTQRFWYGVTETTEPFDQIGTIIAPIWLPSRKMAMRLMPSFYCGQVGPERALFVGSGFRMEQFAPRPLSKVLDSLDGQQIADSQG